MIQASTQSNRVLIIGQEADLTNELAYRLRLTGLVVECAADGEAGVRAASSLLPAVVIVGDDLPDMTPGKLTWRIRSTVPPALVPIFVMDVSVGGRGGRHARDLATQIDIPINHLVNRIAGMFMQYGDEQPIREDIECNGLQLDRRRHRALIDDHPMRLTPTEFNLLWELANRPGFVLSRAELGRVCRGPEKASQTRTVDAHVKSLRRKLRHRSSLIETVHGVGYRFQEIESVIVR
jgi:DNA-binding response OmpR family regulator